MTRSYGSALVPTLIMLAGIGLMLSAIVYVTRHYARVVDVLETNFSMEAAAYVAMLENEARLLKMTPNKRLSVNQTNALSVPDASTDWNNHTGYPDESVAVYAYAKGMIGYIPNELTMFSHNGSYVYSLFSKASHSHKTDGFIYHENFWMNPPKVQAGQSKQYVLKLPGVAQSSVSDQMWEAYLNALEQYTKPITMTLKQGTITISSHVKNGQFDASTLCEEDKNCHLNGSWIISENGWSWVLSVYSDQGAYFWYSDRQGSVDVDDLPHNPDNDKPPICDQKPWLPPCQDDEDEDKKGRGKGSSKGKGGPP